MSSAQVDAHRVTSIDDIPGWFFWIDQQLFGHFLDTAAAPHGNLVELGAYMGKSAALMGRHLREDEVFHVCDLFGADADDAANTQENNRSYSTLDRQAFERNYAALHDRMPVVVQGLSSTIVDHVEPGTARFVHVDASHLYEHVVVDIESARTMLQEDGVVVFDDYRSEHTPGVAAAVWSAVGSGDVRIICVSGTKLYGTFGDPAPHQERLLEWAEGLDGVGVSTEQIAGRPSVRLKVLTTKKTPPKDVALRSLERKIDQLQQQLLKQGKATSRRLDRVEKAVAANGPDLATKVVRRVRARRSR